MAHTPQIFRRWLAERGCSVEETEYGRGGEIATVRVRPGPRQSEIPEAASHKDMAPEDVRRIAHELDLPHDELPGPQSRVSAWNRAAAGTVARVARSRGPARSAMGRHRRAGSPA